MRSCSARGLIQNVGASSEHSWRLGHGKSCSVAPAMSFLCGKSAGECNHHEIKDLSLEYLSDVYLVLLA